MNDIKVSVVVPIFKVEKYLEQCVDSILAQTLKEIEIILVDDGSPDNCGNIIDKYKEQDGRIKCIHKKNGGVSEARNDGLKLCTGEYIYIMDSDDYINNNALEKMYSNALQTGAEVIISDHYTFTDSLNQEEHHFFSQDFFTESTEIINDIICMTLHPSFSPYPTKMNTGLGIGAPWTKLIKSDVINRNGNLFDSEVKGIFDDGLFTINIFQFARSVSYIQECLYHYRILSGSLIHKFNPKRNEIDRIVFDKIEEFGNKYKKSQKFWDAYYARIVMYTSIEIGTFIANKSNRVTLKERADMLDEIIDSDPYNKAFRNVDIYKIENRYKLLVKLIRRRLYTPAVMIYFLK